MITCEKHQQEHNYIGNKSFYRLAILTGLFNLVLFFILMVLVFQQDLTIDSVLKTVSSLFIFYILFAFQSLNDSKQ